MNTYSRFDISFKKGKGCWLWDKTGKRYLDAVAGIATCSLGHSDRVLRRRLSTQLKKIQHISNLYNIEEQEQLSRTLTNMSCAKSVFFCNSGAEANESAIKLIKKYVNIMRDISEIIENVCDYIDRGIVNSVEDGIEEFKKCDFKLNMDLVRKCLEEEFEEGYSELWEEVEVL